MPKMPPGRRPGLSDALYRALTGLSPKSEGKTTQDRAQDLLKQMKGDKRAAQEAAGVSRETFRRWLNGSQEANPDHAERLQKAQRSARVKPRREKKLKDSARKQPRDGGEGGEAGGGAGAPPSTGSPLKIKATVTVSSDTRTRWIDVGSAIPAGMLDRIAPTLVDEGPEKAAGSLTDLVQQHYIRTTGATIDDVQEIRW